jgi:LmbE family N-acetylglucosaminyl deacetylase
VLGLALGDGAASPKQVLLLGAHADDIELGCAGTLLRLIQAHPGIQVCWVVFSGCGVRGSEAHASAAALLDGVATRSVSVHEFEDGFFPYSAATIKRIFEELKENNRPDLVLTHYRDDRHQDHRLISELTWNTFRDHLILEYEVPKYDGDFGSPNVFVRLPEQICQRKIDTLLRYFPSQVRRQWFTEDVFRSVLRLRGMECNSPSRYAEGFYCRKAILAP